MGGSRDPAVTTTRPYPRTPRERRWFTGPSLADGAACQRTTARPETQWGAVSRRVRKTPRKPSLSSFCRRDGQRRWAEVAEESNGENSVNRSGEA